MLRPSFDAHVRMGIFKVSLLWFDPCLGCINATCLSQMLSREALDASSGSIWDASVSERIVSADVRGWWWSQGDDEAFRNFVSNRILWDEAMASTATSFMVPTPPFCYVLSANFMALKPSFFFVFTASSHTPGSLISNSIARAQLQCAVRHIHTRTSHCTQAARRSQSPKHDVLPPHTALCLASSLPLPLLLIPRFVLRLIYPCLFQVSNPRTLLVGLVGGDHVKTGHGIPARLERIMSSMGVPTRVASVRPDPKALRSSPPT